MPNTQARRWSNSTSVFILGRVGAIFALAWLVVALPLWLMKVSLVEWAVSLFLFIGLFFAWIVAVYMLRQKGARLADSLIEEPQDNDDKN